MSNTGNKRHFITVTTHPMPTPKPSPKPSRGFDSPINAQEFITAWQTSGSITEVARKLGMVESAAQQRARQYIKRGVKLKQYPRRPSAARPRLDVDALNQLVDQLSVKGDDK